MACGSCGARRGHLPGCPSAGGGGGGGGTPARRECRPKDHNWVWKRRANPIVGRPYDEYRCSKCPAIDQRPV
jgi:hypothetical protein